MLQPEPSRRSAMTASVTGGRALRYADGSARGLLHHQHGHDLDFAEEANLSLRPASAIATAFLSFATSIPTNALL